ncbi:hypothetical protein [Vibrio sonorensis]|uniref:hypothetical protein n=1 Tax=Vibrio sonorensis TaxID=1004316 RepID=UPI0008DAFD4C|nr:hypothetical protein [Vibrio sonorensis]
MSKRHLMLASLIPLSAIAEEANAPSLSVGMAVDQQLSVVVELEEQYRLTIGNQGGAFDYIVGRGEFDAHTPVDWYVGGGAWGEWDHDFGLRVPLGLNWQVSDGWNAYGQVHPELNLYKGPKLQIGAAIGVTYRF